MKRSLAVIAVTTALAACTPSGNGDTLWLSTNDGGFTLFLSTTQPFNY